MKSIASSFACAQRRDGRSISTVQWARDLVRCPQRYGADERTRQMVAHLLGQVTR